LLGITVLKAGLGSSDRWRGHRMQTGNVETSFSTTHKKEKMKADDVFKAKTNSVFHSAKQQNSIVRIQAGKLCSLSNANVINCLFINYLLIVNIIYEVFIR